MANKPHHVKRCTALEKRRRIKKVQKWLADGLGVNEIIENVLNPKNDSEALNWNIGEDMIRIYIKESWEDFEIMSADEKAYYHRKAIVERDRVKLRALSKGKEDVALRAMDSRDKILGILHDNTNNFNFNTDITEANLTPEVKARLDKELGILFKKKDK
jgi:hypothetical protein